MTQELTEICIISRVQNIWAVEFVDVYTDIPQWGFIMCSDAFKWEVRPNLHQGSRATIVYSRLEEYNFVTCKILNILIFQNSWYQ